MADKDTLKINRLVLVGNGFDLSLGLKTSYRNLKKTTNNKKMRFNAP